MLPKKQTWDMAQTTWAQQLDPLVANPLTQGQLLQGVTLANGTTVVNHKLGRKLMGWFITDINGAATVYRTNYQQTPTLTLSLVSNAVVFCDIWVF